MQVKCPQSGQTVEQDAAFIIGPEMQSGSSRKRNPPPMRGNNEDLS